MTRYVPHKPLSISRFRGPNFLKAHSLDYHLTDCRLCLASSPLGQNGSMGHDHRNCHYFGPQSCHLYPRWGCFHHL